MPLTLMRRPILATGIMLVLGCTLAFVGCGQTSPVVQNGANQPNGHQNGTGTADVQDLQNLDNRLNTAFANLEADRSAAQTDYSQLDAAGLTALAAPTANHVKCGDDLGCVITVGKQLIDNRLDALHHVIDRVNERPGLTEHQRDPIINSANTAIDGLQALRAKLGDATNIVNARADVQSIFTQFRIFAVQIPTDYALVWLDELSNIHAIFVSREPAIQTAILKHGSPSNTQQLYNDLVAQVNNAGGAINAGQTLIPSLIPANYPATTQTLATLKGDLQAAHGDLKTARSDLQQIIAALKH